MSINFSEDAQQEVVTSSRVLPEDSGEGSLRPRLLRDYTGQEKAKENLQVCIDAARLRGEPLDHVLLYGPPGLGKTTMAAVIANEMGVNMRITSGPAIEKAGDLAALLTNLQENDILFVDEDPRCRRLLEKADAHRYAPDGCSARQALLPRQHLRQLPGTAALHLTVGKYPSSFKLQYHKTNYN